MGLSAFRKISSAISLGVSSPSRPNRLTSQAARVGVMVSCVTISIFCCVRRAMALYSSVSLW